MKKLNENLYYLGSFILLFAIYHWAEYQVMFTFKPFQFLGIQALFFGTAFFLGRRKFLHGFKTWGLFGGNGLGNEIALGALMGSLVYIIPFLVSLYLGFEKIVSIPNGELFFPQAGLMLFGLFFSSALEDILTRGVVFARFHNRLNPFIVVLLSAAIYYFNHIYRIGDGWIFFIYLFLLGVQFYLALLLTNRLWMTVMIHWVGNCTFYITHQWMVVDQIHPNIGFNQLLIGAVLMNCLVLYALIKRKKNKRSTFSYL